jgi:hypothetical protein
MRDSFDIIVFLIMLYVVSGAITGLIISFLPPGEKSKRIKQNAIIVYGLFFVLIVLIGVDAYVQVEKQKKVVTYYVGEMDSTIKKDSIKRLQVTTQKNNEQHINDSTRIADSLAWVDPDTAFSHHAVDVIDKFQECKLADEFIDSVSNHKRGLIIEIWGMPSKDEPYYDIGAGDEVPIGDSTTHFDKYMNFRVRRNSKQPAITYYNPGSDIEMSLTKWREKENMNRKKTGKYYFFCL